MTSPRPALKDLKLEANTFGDTPAAIYLVELLNKKNDRVLARKTAKILAEGRELVADLARAHIDYDALSTKSFAKLIPLISEHFQTKATLSLRQVDEHVANLTINVLEGGLKTWKNRVQHARRSERAYARELPPGVSSTWIPAKPLVNETTSETLRKRSKQYLARKGKIDTLY